MTVMQQLVDQADVLLKSSPLEGWARKMKAEGGEHPFTWCVNKASAFIDDPKGFCAKIHLLAYGKTPMQRKAERKAIESKSHLVKAAKHIKNRPKGWKRGKTPEFKEHPSVVRYRDPSIRTQLAAGKSAGHTHARFVANPECCSECSRLDGTVRAISTVKGWTYTLPHPNCLCSWELGYMDNGQFTTDRPTQLKSNTDQDICKGFMKLLPIPRLVKVLVTDKHGNRIYRWKRLDKVSAEEKLKHHAKGGETKPSKAAAVSSGSESWHTILARDFMANANTDKPVRIRKQDKTVKVETRSAIRRVLKPEQLSESVLSNMREGDVLESHKGTSTVRVTKREGHYVITGTGMTMPVWVIRPSLAMHYLTGTLHAHKKHRERLYRRLAAADVDTEKSLRGIAFF